MTSSPFKSMKQRQPLSDLKQLRPAGGAKKEKSLFFSLNLTTLIDAFCILVIFLLSNMNGRLQNLEPEKGMSLPVAAQTEQLEEGIIIKVIGGEFIISDQKISANDLTSSLIAAKKSGQSSLIIQADRGSNYEQIGQALKAGGQAGFEKYIFAVLPGA